MKYVMFSKKSGDMELHIPVIFPNMLVHADVAAALTAKGAPLDGCSPVSAGSISCLDIDANCHGESTTLNLKPLETDDSTIAYNDYGGGIL